MYRIVDKQRLAPTIRRITIEAPYVTRHAKAGQFIILRVEDEGERIPMTIADFDRKKGTITVIYQIVGATTKKLDRLEAGDGLRDLVGPLGRASRIEGLKRALVIGGGVGCAIAYPTAKALSKQGTCVEAIIGFRNEELVILEREFISVTDHLDVMTDDGSYGSKGFVTDRLSELLEAGKRYDEIFAIGPLPMMKRVSDITRPYGIRTTVSMNPIMIDGTGMCGGCRLTVGSETKFACVDGPEFDGHQVDFTEVMRRNRMYAEEEKRQYEATRRLFKEDAHDQ
ncbi:MAG: sulfide/dihydroorotate dehydrogenase-like FAD/NAD-binding protein [Acholeplasmataceae bacterium]